MYQIIHGSLGNPCITSDVVYTIIPPPRSTLGQLSMIICQSIINAVTHSIKSGSVSPHQPSVGGGGITRLGGGHHRVFMISMLHYYAAVIQHCIMLIIYHMMPAPETYSNITVMRNYQRTSARDIRGIMQHIMYDYRVYVIMTVSPAYIMNVVWFGFM